MMKAEEALALANAYTDSHGGGGGTSDYSQLTNQPKVNNVTLIGNKTTEDLIPIGNGLGFNADGELEATGGSDVLVIEAVIYNETPELYSISFGKSLTEIVSDIGGVNGNAIVKIWTTSSKLTCYLSETFNNDGSGNWVTNVRRYSNNYDIVCRDVLMIGNSSDNKKSVWKYPLQKNLTFDSQPTAGSNNPVTSDGIYAADKEIKDKLQGSKTATGNPLEVSDYGMTERLVVDFEPIQDLHGYDKPWAGGAGKNKLNYDAWKTVTIQRGTAVWENNGVTLTATSNDCYTGSSNFPVDARVPISEGETIILSWEEDTNTEGLVYIFPNDSATGLVVANNLFRKSLEYTATEGVTYVTFRFGVANSGDTASYKNIMIRLSTESDADFEPYSNICPIEGRDSVTVSVDYGGGTVDDYELEFGETFYGGQARYTEGIATSLWSYIASYNGETLPYLWVSDRDEYAIGTTPTIGAEVVYYGGPDAKTIHVEPIEVDMTDETPISTDGKSISLTYQPKNTVLLEAKEYTDQELSPVNTRINGLDTRVQILENGGDRSLNYSTTEQVVGTWIDGKPLYQITKQWQVPSQGAGQWNNYSVGNLGTLGYMNISELAFDYSTSNYRFGNSVGLGTMEVSSNFEKVGARLGYNTESGNVFVQLENVGTTSPLYQYGGTMTATIRYTKTTD